MPTNILSIDVEDWYHPLDPDPGRWDRYEDRVVPACATLLDVLAEAKARATFFVLGEVARRHPELVRRIAAAGHEVGSHGTRHRFVYRQSPAEFEADVGESLALLAPLAGAPVRGYRAPYFSITRRSRWALPVLRRLGFAYDSSIFPVLNHRYGDPSAPRLPYPVEGLLELPVSTYPAAGVNLPFAGGVYFRFLPYRAVARMTRALNRRGERVVFYLHPWEVDPGHPRLRVAPALRLRHYWGLRHTAARLRRLLSEFPFGSVREVLNP